MKPTVILSTTSDPDYLFCLPIVAKSWELQGWKVCILMFGGGWTWMIKYMNVQNINIVGVDKKIDCPNNPALLSQVIRLYHPQGMKDGEYVLLSDVDMFIGGDFLYRDFHKVNVFGHDLTGRQHIPICYIGAPVIEWWKIMHSGTIQYDMEAYCDLTDKQRAWTCDQDILTAKLKAYGYDKINFIDRGTDPDNHNLPIGRWDRYGGFIKPGRTVRDCHLPRFPYNSFNFPMIEQMCLDLYPKENWNWLMEYRNEFLKVVAKNLITTP